MATRRGVLALRQSLLSAQWYGYEKMVNNEWDPAKKYPTTAVSISNNNKTLTRNSGSAWISQGAKYGMPTDRNSILEFHYKRGVNLYSYIGFITTNWASSDLLAGIGSVAGSGYFCPMVSQGGTVLAGSGVSKVPGGLGVKSCAVPGDVVAMGFDYASGTVKFWRNGFQLNSGAPVLWGLQGKTILPMVYTYNPGGEVTMYAGDSLKYNYPGFSLPAEGKIYAGDGYVALDPARKPAIGAVYDGDFSVFSGSTAAAYETGFCDTLFKPSEKSFVEFIVQWPSTQTEHYIGASFDSDQSGPKSGNLGSILNSLGVKVTNAALVFTGNGCTVASGIASKYVIEGDVLCFGYDPATKSVMLWINGVSVNGVNPVWTNLPGNPVCAAYSLKNNTSSVRVNSDLPKFTYSGYSPAA